MNRKQELEIKIMELRSKLSEIEYQERIDTHKQYVDKYFKFRNNYSCPKEESDYWWMYIYVNNLDENGFLIGITFQTDSEGKITIEEDNRISSNLLYEEIAKDEFVTEFKNFLGNISSLSLKFY